MLSYFLSLFNYLFIFVGLSCFDYAIILVIWFGLVLFFRVVVGLLVLVFYFIQVGLSLVCRKLA